MALLPPINLPLGIMHFLSFIPSNRYLQSTRFCGRVVLTLATPRLRDGVVSPVHLAELKEREHGGDVVEVVFFAAGLQKENLPIGDLRKSRRHYCTCRTRSDYDEIETSKIWKVFML
jgi:hypothetical protein